MELQNILQIFIIKTYSDLINPGLIYWGVTKKHIFSVRSSVRLCTGGFGLRQIIHFKTRFVVCPRKWKKKKVCLPESALVYLFPLEFCLW